MLATSPATATLPDFPTRAARGSVPATGDPRLALVSADTSDLPWLRGLFRQSRWWEIEQAGWETAMGTAFLDQQFALQHLHYVRHYPSAHYWIVTRDGIPCGRLYADLDPARHLLIDILLDVQARGHGIGTRLLTALKASASTHGCPLDLHVQINNPDARRLYEREGFAVDGSTATHLSMRWQPITGQADPAVEL